MGNDKNPFQAQADNTDTAGGEAPARPESAPMPPRVAAFATDVFCLLILIVLANVITFSRNPNVAEEFERYTEEMQEYRERNAGDPEGGSETPPALSDEARSVIRFTYILLLVLVLAYFVVGEIATQGASPGKRLFRLRVVRTDPGAGQSLPIGATVTRSVIKAVSLALAMTLQPIMLLLLFNYFFAFLSRERRAGHDYLARTQVVVIPRDSNHDTLSAPENPPS